MWLVVMVSWCGGGVVAWWRGDDTSDLFFDELYISSDSFELNAPYMAFHVLIMNGVSFCIVSVVSVVSVGSVVSVVRVSVVMWWVEVL